MGLLQIANRLEFRICLVANRSAQVKQVLRIFRVVSRLGDGVIWYLLILAMPLLMGWEGLKASLQLSVVGLVSLMTYRQLKTRFVRERPFVRWIGIKCQMPPLDRYSFPSGHTLHAVAFSAVACSHMPMLAWLLIPLALMIAASRVILGLHYPSDVLAGAALGLLLARLSVPFFQ